MHNSMIYIIVSIEIQMCIERREAHKILEYKIVKVILERLKLYKIFIKYELIIKNTRYYIFT
jgi:hypothetical protein